MADLELVIEELCDIALRPGKMLGRYLSEGKRVVGCFPLYTPEELVHASGAIPMGLWGGQVNPTMAGRYNPIFTCSIMRSCLEYGMIGTYGGFAGVVMPMLCDTFRGMSAAWRAGVAAIPVLPFVHPQNRTDSGASIFLRDEYNSLRVRLEAILGRPIKDKDLEESIGVYNEHSALMMQFTEIANEHLDVITPVVRHQVMKSALFMEKAEHSRKMRALLNELAKRPTHVWRGKKLILTGITAEPRELLDIFHENDIAVVADDLAQESRQYRTPIPEGNDPLGRLVEQWFDRHDCSSVHESRGSRGAMLSELARKARADGIAFCLMRFCDIEEYDYPYVSMGLEKAGLPTLCLEIDQSTQNNEQSRTKLQAFVEML